ncbi:MAG TPA: hypothetical protein VF618_24455 [Thermoanaerobaculia bacterium]
MYLRIAAILLLVLQEREPVPATLKSRNPHRGAPLWVAARHAADAEGRLRGVLFRKGTPERLRSLPAGSCLGEVPVEIHRPDRTLGELTRSSVSIFNGTVEEVAAGFFADTAGSLLNVRIDAIVKGSPQYDTSGGTIYVYYPSASFVVGRQSFCAIPATHRARPVAGDRVLVFALDAPADTRGRIVYPQASRHLIFQTAGGELLLPNHLQANLAGFATIDGIVQRVEAELALLPAVDEGLNR